MPESRQHRDEQISSETSPLLRSGSQVDGVADASDGAAAPLHAQRLSVTRSLFISLPAGLLIFLQACNFSLLTTIQGAVAKDLDAYEYTTWLTAAFLVPLSSCGPIAGKLSQVFSPRRCVLFGCAAFAAGNVISSAAHNVSIFLLGRASTGMGAAFIINSLVIFILQTVSAERRGALLAAVNVAVTLGTSLGAVLTGALEPTIGWRILFWAQAPLISIAGFVVFFSIPPHDSPGAERSAKKMLQKLKRVDYLGAVTLTAATTALLVSLSARQIPLVLMTVALALFPTFVLIETHFAQDPIVPMAVLKSRGAFLSCVALLLFMIPRWALVFYTPVYAIAVRGWVPAVAGLMLIPTTSGFGLGALAAGLLHIRRAGSFYLPSVLAFSLATAALAMISFALGPDSSIILFVIGSFFHGFFTGSAVSYSLVHILHLTPHSTHGMVPTLHGLFRGSAGSFGAAIGGGIFSRLLHSQLRRSFLDRGLDEMKELLRQIAGNPRLVSQLNGAEYDAAQEAYTVSLKGLFLAGLIATVAAVILQAFTGWTGADEVTDDSAGDEAAEFEEAERTYRA